MSATVLNLRLRADLNAAMQAKAADEVRLLRTLIAALDNAEAVAEPPKAFGSRAFGDPSGEVPRREIDAPALDALLLAEIDARLTAAEDYDRHKQDAEAARLRREAELIARYRA
jgi:uncharacterized protein YqeY